jgi:hypothetical protein
LEAGHVDKIQGRAKLDEIERAIAQDDVAISAAAQVQTRRVIYYAQAQGVAEGLQESQIADEAQVVRYLGGEAAVDRYRAQVTVVDDEDDEDDDGSTTLASSGETRTAYAKASGARVRAQPTTEAAEVVFLKPGTAVQVVGPAQANPAWSEVRHAGKSGFIRSDLLASTRPAKAAAPVIVAAAPVKPGRPKGPTLVRVSTPMVAASAPKDRARQAIGARRSFADTRTADKAATLRELEALRRLV